MLDRAGGPVLSHPPWHAQSPNFSVALFPGIGQALQGQGSSYLFLAHGIVPVPINVCWNAAQMNESTTVSITLWGQGLGVFLVLASAVISQGAQIPDQIFSKCYKDQSYKCDHRNSFYAL